MMDEIFGEGGLHQCDVEAQKRFLTTDNVILWGIHSRRPSGRFYLETALKIFRNPIKETDRTVSRREMATCR
ncbi:hypothetical protein KCP74_24875 [Salmonella enterica subsp. enterica]|nr:hypothetical protein KCP74_24875 [Salmonella enterica subsp. enterica]